MPWTMSATRPCWTRVTKIQCPHIRFRVLIDARFYWDTRNYAFYVVLSHKLGTYREYNVLSPNAEFQKGFLRRATRRITLGKMKCLQCGVYGPSECRECAPPVNGVCSIESIIASMDSCKSVEETLGKTSGLSLPWADSESSFSSLPSTKSTPPLIPETPLCQLQCLQSLQPKARKRRQKRTSTWYQRTLGYTCD